MRQQLSASLTVIGVLFYIEPTLAKQELHSHLSQHCFETLVLKDFDKEKIIEQQSASVAS